LLPAELLLLLQRLLLGAGLQKRGHHGLLLWALSGETGGAESGGGRVASGGKANTPGTTTITTLVKSKCALCLFALVARAQGA